MDNTRVFKMSFAGVYPHYIQKAEKKGRTKEEADAIICWLTGYNQQALQQQIDKKSDELDKQWMPLHPSRSRCMIF